jgi:ABC-2 type transport system permease protein
VALPVEVFLGKHPGADVLPVFGVQLLWMAVLVLIGRAVLSRAVTKVVVQGG